MLLKFRSPFIVSGPAGGLFVDFPQRVVAPHAARTKLLHSHEHQREIYRFRITVGSGKLLFNQDRPRLAEPRNHVG